MSWPPWVCPLSRHVHFPSLHFSGSLVVLLGNCLRWALGCMHFLGLSHSDSSSRVFHKGANLVRSAFVPFPGPSSSGYQVLEECSLSTVGSASYHLPRPSHSVSWVAAGRPVSGVPCVSSGELIPGCEPPGGCQPSRIPRNLG